MAGSVVSGAKFVARIPSRQSPSFWKRVEHAPLWVKTAVPVIVGIVIVSVTRLFALVTRP